MMVCDCEAVRDVLPALARGALPPQEASAAEQHLRLCGECREEAALVRLIQESCEPLPARLETRVLTAVRRAPVRPRRWTPVRVALAASVAAALFAGALLSRYLDTPAASELAGLLDADFEAASMLGLAHDDALLHSGTSLQELTVEELEILLAELES